MNNAPPKKLSRNVIVGWNSFQQGAFTLLEMIVAIAIFAVIAVISYASLNRFLDNSAVIETELEELRQLQLAFSILEQDMRFISGRTVRDQYGDPEQLLILNNQLESGELLRFTTARRDMRVPAASALQRVAYRLEDGEFTRNSWSVLDRDQESALLTHLLLEKVENIQLNLLRKQEGVVQSETILEGAEELPDGIEWQFQMEDGKEYTRVFEIKHAQQ